MPAKGGNGSGISAESGGFRSPGRTGSLELGYYLVPNISASLTIGIPPVMHVDGTGVLAAVGRLGDVRYGLGAFFIKYHFIEWGRFQSFAGAGLAYFKVLSTSDVGVTNLNVDDSLGPALQIGAGFMINPQIGLFASESHAFYTPTARAPVWDCPSRQISNLIRPCFRAGLLFVFDAPKLPPIAAANHFSQRG